LSSKVTLLILTAMALGAGAPAAPSGDPAARAAGPAPAGRAAVSEPAALNTLRAGLDRLVQSPATRGERWSILVVSLDRGDTLFAHTPGEALAPASNMKLFTSAAALEYLGPDFRYVTYLFTDGPIRDGVVEGNLYLYGTGDPTLGSRFAQSAAPALVALADSLRARGVREIRGDLIGDGSYFAGPGTGEGWHPDNLNAWYAPQAGALSVHENLVRVEVRPGAPGGPPELSYVPGGEGVAVLNQAVTGSGGRVDVRRMEYGGPIVVRGRIASGNPSFAVSVGDPAMYAAALFRDVLLRREIAVHGTVHAITDAARSPVTSRTVFAPAYDAEAPRLQVLGVHTSAPLPEILTVINHQSQNFYSEQVLRTLGRAVGGDGSAVAGGWAVKQLLARAGVDTAGVHVADGCGLSPLNLASARSFVALLDYMARSPHADLFRESLPVAGEVRRFRRMGGTPAAGNLQAKTGTIERVSALSGYVRAANGERLAFSIISNDISVPRGKYIENMIGAQLAAFDRTVPVEGPLTEIAAGE
jgi:serine-type D-Ala-D-Ala carboxypeptidase/endopeptidase (penicillin-binding protein 4)